MSDHIFEGQLVWLDPNTLAAHPANIRDEAKDADLTELAASITANGIVEPLVVVPDDEGHRIVAGHRRCAAAITAGHERVPCVVRTDLSKDVDQLVAMLVENIRRRDLTAAEEAKGYHQLRLAGLSRARIAKATGTRPADVKRSLTVAGSEVASATTARYGLSLLQGLVVAEFEDDLEVVKQLVITAQRDPDRWDHVVARARADREARIAFAAAVARLVEAGVRVIDQDDPPEHTLRLNYLASSATGAPLDPEAHVSCPGHAVAISPYDPDRTFAYCTDPETHGHTDRYASRTGSDRNTGRTEDGKMTEEAKAERRAVIEGNRAWRAAREVRREFLRGLMARKVAPKSTLRFVARTIVARPERVGDGSENLVAQLLGRTRSDNDRHVWGRQAGPAALDDASDARVPLVLLAQVAADAETALADHVWREARPEVAAQWLTWLAEIGYALSEIEATVVAAGAGAGAGAGAASAGQVGEEVTPGS